MQNYHPNSCCYINDLLHLVEMLSEAFKRDWDFEGIRTGRKVSARKALQTRKQFFFPVRTGCLRVYGRYAPSYDI